ncbi:MAG: hypothetical protein L0Y79_00890, partial [Chlorobi bacterium]|nr:hypothetical protein [Chlorobiota bacterium]
MLNYTFLEIWETFTKAELKQFRRFIRSPYFFRSNKVLRLYDEIIRYHPHFESRNLTKEKLLQKVSPELPYNEITMRRLLFDLQNLTEKFTRQLNFEKKQIESRIYMTEEIGARGAEKLFFKNVKQTQNMLDSLGYIDSDVCLSRFRLETDQFYYKMINNKINRKSFVQTEAKTLINGITYLINYFMLEAIKHNDTLLNYSRSFNVKYNEKVINEFINLFDFERLEIFMKKNSLIGSFIIEVYLNALKSYLYFENDHNYEEFKTSLYKYRNRLSSNDNNFLFIRLQGYCILKIKNNSETSNDYNRELFELNKIILSEKYYETETNKYISVDLFRNILLHSIKLKELSWLEDFISEYGLQLHPKRRADIINFSYALLYFERNAYEQSLAYLSNIKMNEFIYNLDVRNLCLRIYFEQRDFTTANAFVKSYQEFLSSNELISHQVKAEHENFFKFIKKLINHFNRKTKTDLGTL